MNVSIVIPNWNGRELLAEFFPSVVAATEYYRVHTTQEIEIIVVDDASFDDGVDWLVKNYGVTGSVRIIVNEQNLGFLRTVKKGIADAAGDLVFLINNDVQIEQDCLAPLVRHFNEQDVFAVCCRAMRIGTDRLDGGGKLGRFERGFWRVFLNYEVVPEQAAAEFFSFYGSGGYTMYDRRKWAQLGGFQDILSPNYWEDVEICYRAWKRGWKVVYEPESRVAHLGSASMNKKERGELDITTERNRLLMTWINLHDRGMFGGHIFWLSVKLFGSLISLRWNYLSAFRQAIGKVSKVRKARGIEKNESLITDRELERKFTDIVTHPGIYVVATEEDEIAFSQIRDTKLGSNK
jgi:GT2 family glycosyltransferase